MFTYGFGPGETPAPGEIPKIYKTPEGAKVKPSMELKIEESGDLYERLMKACQDYTDSSGIKYASTINAVLEMLSTDEDDDEPSPVMQAECQDSDLLPGIYEGGLKIWECTYDVLKFIDNENMNFENKKVLDLGCGAGLIGIKCMTRGATCYFQDYNDEVLKYVTYLNVTANLENFPHSKDFKLFTGDWSSFLELWQKSYSDEEKFDCIFSSETIYSPSNYLNLVRIFENLLKPDGVVYLAAKAYYFGCGGGLLDFRNLLDIRGSFKYRTLWQFTEGLVREIVEIKLRQ